MRVGSFVTEVLAVSDFLAGARLRTLEAEENMSDAAKALQAPLARLLSGDMEGLAREAREALASEATAEGGEGPAASASSQTPPRLLMLILRATASPGQARH